MSTWDGDFFRENELQYPALGNSKKFEIHFNDAVAYNLISEHSDYHGLSLDIVIAAAKHASHLARIISISELFTVSPAD